MHNNTRNTLTGLDQNSPIALMTYRLSHLHAMNGSRNEEIWDTFKLTDEHKGF